MKVVKESDFATLAAQSYKDVHATEYPCGCVLWNSELVEKRYNRLIKTINDRGDDLPRDEIDRILGSHRFTGQLCPICDKYKSSGVAADDDDIIYGPFVCLDCVREMHSLINGDSYGKGP